MKSDRRPKQAEDMSGWEKRKVIVHPGSMVLWPGDQVFVLEREGEVRGVVTRYDEEGYMHYAVIPPKVRWKP